MKIFVKAKPNSKNSAIKKVNENEYVVAVCEPPVRGRANRAIVRVLAEYFKIPSFKIKLISGFTSKNKIFSLDES